MTVLPTERAIPDAPAPAPVEAHPRLERRRQRRRHKVEAAIVVLALPLAVALTLFMLLTASGGNVLEVDGASASETVRVEGALSIEAADRLVGDGLVLDVTSAAGTLERTEVVYFSSGDRHRAEELADAIGAKVVVLGTSRPAGATFVIRVGEDVRP